ncbi:Flavin monooxygenase-like [Dillenia turbinata]|uniref:Flavin-containing monooxygenase n=1 Tax=Dillenia turbinata TaxID=194707 RepID=A0AAN8ZLS9_9MAGN
MERRVVIIGAGMSGLLACKYLVQKGFHPIVFEADSRVGGLWKHTAESTKLQNSKGFYEFTDFLWPDSVQEIYPRHDQVMEYFESYAEHFGIVPHIKFNCIVGGIDYVGESNEEMQSWDLWSGTGKAFGSRGKWHIEVLDTEKNSTEIHEAEFVVLCIGRFSGLANIPDFPAGQGPEVFSGKVMHSMDYSALDNATAAELIKRKRIAIIGSQKTAVEIATECANANGVDNPCIMVYRSVHWNLPSIWIWGINFGYLYANRFSELLVHKPGESFFLSCLATLLSPLKWAISKFTESYIRWKLPLKKYGIVPKHSITYDLSSCAISLTAEGFYDKVEEGSITLKKSQNFRFCKEGLVVEGEAEPLKPDLVILATGYKGDEKLKNMFKSPTFQKEIMGYPHLPIPLYREMVHPRIPQLAIVGYSESVSNLYTTEVRCQWLAHFLDGNMQLPNIKVMEKDATMWAEYMKRYAGCNYRRSCIAGIPIWSNDQLCKDMGCNHKRKKVFFNELFQPYGPADYAELSSLSKKKGFFNELFQPYGPADYAELSSLSKKVVNA